MSPSTADNSLQDSIAAVIDKIDVAPLVPKKLYLQNAKEVAEELTLIDAELLAKIEHKELENGEWMKRASKV